MSREWMGVNMNKAGMDKVPKDVVNEIVYQLSKNSAFFIKEKKQEEVYEQKAKEIKNEIENAKLLQLESNLVFMDDLIKQIKDQMIFDRYIVHVDMDMFYAACEERENPSLSGKIFAVGGNSMLSTANYEARKYGIRAGMPGFIGKVLARKLANSELILVPCNFELYKGISKSVQEVFADYDPNFSMLSLDEGYLDFTEHLRTRADKSDFEKAIVTEACDTCGKRYLEITEMRLELKFFGEKIDESKEKFHKFERKDQKSIDFESVCDVLDLSENKENQTFQSELPELELSRMQKTLTEKIDEFQINQAFCENCSRTYFGNDIESAVSEMRAKVEEKTKLTCSAGIGPNSLIAKIGSDYNKPNGQFRVQNDPEEVLEFIQKLDVRKAPGIGKRTEAILSLAFSIKSVADLFEKRHLLPIGFKQATLEHFCGIMLGNGSSYVRSRNEEGQTQMGHETTFSATNSKNEIQKILAELAEKLSSDLLAKNLRGRTVTLKITTDKFDKFTRSKTIPNPTNLYEDLLRISSQLFIKNFEYKTLRLIGISLSKFETEKSSANSILNFFKHSKNFEKMAEKTETEIYEKVEKSSNLVESLLLSNSSPNSSQDSCSKSLHKKSHSLNDQQSGTTYKKESLFKDQIIDRSKFQTFPEKLKPKSPQKSAKPTHSKNISSNQKSLFWKRTSLPEKPSTSKEVIIIDDTILEPTKSEDNGIFHISEDEFPIIEEDEILVSKISVVEPQIPPPDSILSSSDEESRPSANSVECPLCSKFYFTLKTLDAHIFRGKCQIVKSILNAKKRMDISLPNEEIITTSRISEVNSRKRKSEHDFDFSKKRKSN